MVALKPFQSMKQSALLQVGPVYDTLDFPLVAWPCTTPRASQLLTLRLAQCLSQLPRDDARDCASRWSELMFNSEAEQKLIDATIEPPRLYQDPILGCSRVFYRRFIRTIFRKRLLVRFSRTPRFHCTCFFVHEKQGRQHLIEDAGETNRHFKRATSVALVSLEALAGLECSADSRFWISTVDVRDALHRMALPDDLSHCFSLRGSSVSTSLMGSRLAVTTACGRAASAYPWVLAGRRWLRPLVSQKVSFSTIAR